MRRLYLLLSGIQVANHSDSDSGEFNSGELPQLVAAGSPQMAIPDMDAEVCSRFRDFEMLAAHSLKPHRGTPA